MYVESGLILAHAKTRKHRVLTLAHRSTHVLPHAVMKHTLEAKFISYHRRNHVSLSIHLGTHACCNESRIRSKDISYQRLNHVSYLSSMKQQIHLAFSYICAYNVGSGSVCGYTRHHKGSRLPGRYASPRLQRYVFAFTDVDLCMRACGVFVFVCVWGVSTRRYASPLLQRSVSAPTYVVVNVCACLCVCVLVLAVFVFRAMRRHGFKGTDDELCTCVRARACGVLCGVLFVTVWEVLPIVCLTLFLGHPFLRSSTLYFFLITFIVGTCRLASNTRCVANASISGRHRCAPRPRQGLEGKEDGGTHGPEAAHRAQSCGI